MTKTINVRKRTGSMDIQKELRKTEKHPFFNVQLVSDDTINISGRKSIRRNKFERKAYALKRPLLKTLFFIGMMCFIFGCLFIFVSMMKTPVNADNNICNSDKCEARVKNIKGCEKKYTDKKDIVLCATQKVVRIRKNEMTVNDFRNARQEIDNLYDMMYQESIEEQAFNFIKDFEGYHEKAYWDYVRYSIGYGTPANGRKTITKEQAKQEVIHRIQDILKKMEGVELTNNQKIALVSYFYNAGFKKSVIGYAKKGDHKSVTYILNKSVYAKGKKLGGLVKRRGAEVSLYLKQIPYDFKK